jgi:hypothetical protein
MVDRLSTLQIFQSGLSNILDRQADLARTQSELASGKKILSPSDDPSGAVKILDIEEDLRLVDQYQRNASTAEGQLAREESTLSDVTNVLQRVRELVVQANNATQTRKRARIAVELRGAPRRTGVPGQHPRRQRRIHFCRFSVRHAAFHPPGRAGDLQRRRRAALYRYRRRRAGGRARPGSGISGGACRQRQLRFRADPGNSGTAVVQQQQRRRQLCATTTP